MAATRRPTKVEQVQTQPLIALIDGPMQGQWFWLSDWRELCDSARYMVSKGQRPDRCLLYRETGAQVPHRAHGEWVGRAWTTKPEGETR